MWRFILWSDRICIYVWLCPFYSGHQPLRREAGATARAKKMPRVEPRLTCLRLIHLPHPMRAPPFSIGQETAGVLFLDPGTNYCGACFTAKPSRPAPLPPCFDPASHLPLWP